MRSFKIILPLALFFGFVFITHYQALGLGIYGDDWALVAQAVKPIRPDTTPKNTTTYESGRIYMTALYKLFGYENSKPYYLSSLIFKAVAAFGIFYLFYKKSSNYPAAVIAGSIFSVTPTGLQTTDWVFNSPAYLSIFFLCLFFSSKFSFKRYLWLILSLVLMAHRTLAVIPFLFIYYVFSPQSRRVLKLLLLIIITATLWQFHLFGSISGNSPRLRAAATIFKNQNYIYPLQTISNIFLPEGTITPRESILFGLLILTIATRLSPLASVAIIASFAFPTLSAPYVPLPTTHRYLIISAMVQAIVSVMIFKKLPLKIGLIIATSYVFLLASNSYNYWNDQLLKHPGYLTNRLWSQFQAYVPHIPKVISTTDKSNYFVFLFIPSDPAAKIYYYPTIDFSTTFKILSLYKEFNLTTEPAYFYTSNSKEFSEFVNRNHISESQQFIFEIKNNNLVLLQDKSNVGKRVE